VQRACLGGFQDQAGVKVIFRAHKGGVITGVSVGQDFERLLGVDLLAAGGSQLDRDLAVMAGFREHVEKGGLALFHGDAAIADVINLPAVLKDGLQGDQAVGVQDVLMVQLHPRVFGVPGGNGGVGGLVVFHPASQALAVMELPFPIRGGKEEIVVFILRSAPGGDEGVFKGAVADHLGVDAGIAGTVDILKEQAVEGSCDRELDFPGLNGKLTHENAPFICYLANDLLYFTMLVPVRTVGPGTLEEMPVPPSPAARFPRTLIRSAALPGRW